MNRITITALVVSVALVACAAIEKIDPGPTTPQQIANTYAPCPGVPAPGCLRDGEQCDDVHGKCLTVFPAPILDSKPKPDAGAALVPTTALSPLEAPKSVLTVESDGHG